MAALNTELLLPDAQCVNACIPPGYQLAALISIFAKIAQMNIDSATLMANALCVNSCIPHGYQMAVLVSLAVQIHADMGTLQSGAQVFAYTGASPTADGLVPTNPNNPAIAYKNNGAGPSYNWDVAAHVWR